MTDDMTAYLVKIGSDPVQLKQGRVCAVTLYLRKDTANRMGL